MGMSWQRIRENARKNSPFSNVPNWDVISVIFKHGDDARQEVLAMQIIRLLNHVWKRAKLPLWLRPYSVLVTGAQSGLIETIPDAVSIDALKKRVPHFSSLASFFHTYFGLQGPERHERAIMNYVESMAAYSVVCYLLQIKDRHNGNIMMDRDGVE
jgi:phosphatidylinositol 4-kinase